MRPPAALACACLKAACLLLVLSGFQSLSGLDTAYPMRARPEVTSGGPLLLRFGRRTLGRKAARR